jgi:hypothetical protein
VVPKLWGALSGGIVGMKGIFILKEMWAQDKIYIGNLLD